MDRLYPKWFEKMGLAGMYACKIWAAGGVVRQALGHKKIVIISGDRITSIPISSRMQVFIVAIMLGFMLWVSYSSGKYFAFENVLSKKEKQIWTTSVTNENLQFQVTDLHQNLIELNKYFDNIRKYDQLAQRPIFERDDEDIAKMAALKRDKTARETQQILANIRQKVVERVGSLEKIIEMTGVRLEEIATYDGDLKRFLLEKASHGELKHQGGPFEPVGFFEGDANETDSLEETPLNFQDEVSYLLRLERVVHSLPIAVPMKRYWVSSGFGTRMDPIRKRLAVHQGMDFVGSYRARVYSTAPGVVVYARHFGAYGKFIEIDHGFGVTTRYGHLDKIMVEEGQKVDRWQVIGLQGNTGRSTGNHLHYEVRYHHRPMDPKHFVKAGEYVF